MKTLRKYIFISFVFILLTSQPYFNGFILVEIKSDHDLKTNGLIVLKVGEDLAIEKGIQNTIKLLKGDKRQSRIIEIDSHEELASTLFRYNLYQIAILAHGSKDGILIGESLLSWKSLAELFNNREQVTYFTSCYSNSILSHITNQKTKMLTFAPWKGIVDQKIAALSTGAIFLAIHGEKNKAVDINQTNHCTKLNPNKLLEEG